MNNRNSQVAALAVILVLIGGTTWIAGVAGQDAENLADPAPNSSLAQTEPAQWIGGPPTPTSWYADAQDAVEKGLTEEAMHLFELEIRQGGQARVEAMEQLEQIRCREALEAESNSDFDQAFGHLKQWSTLLDDLKRADESGGSLSANERQLLFAARARHRERLQTHQRDRQRFFESEAHQHLRRVENAFSRGKRPWYWNDDESCFEEALLELNSAWSRCLADVGEDTRRSLADWHALLKGELNSKQYEETMEKSRIILGVDFPAADAVGGAL